MNIVTLANVTKQRPGRLGSIVQDELGIVYIMINPAVGYDFVCLNDGTKHKTIGVYTEIISGTLTLEIMEAK